MRAGAAGLFFWVGWSNDGDDDDVDGWDGRWEREREGREDGEVDGWLVRGEEGARAGVACLVDMLAGLSSDLLSRPSSPSARPIDTGATDATR